MGNNPDITFKVRPKRVTPQFRREREEAYVVCSFLPAAKPSGPRELFELFFLLCEGELFDVNFWLSYVIPFSHSYFLGGGICRSLTRFLFWVGSNSSISNHFFCCRRSLDKVWSCSFLFFEASSALSLSNMLRLRQITKRGEGGEQKGTINQCVPSSFSEESSSLAVYNAPDQATAHQGRSDIPRTLYLNNKGTISHKMEMESY